MDFPSVAITIVGIYLAYKEFRSGSKKISSEVITNYEVLDKQQKEYIERCDKNLVGATAVINDMKIEFTDRIANLEGVVGEKDKQLQNLTSILANRNPELTNVLQEIKDFMKQLTNVNLKQTDILNTQQKRSKKIDDASKKNKGVLMRNPVE